MDNDKEGTILTWVLVGVVHFFLTMIGQAIPAAGLGNADRQM
jgi:hypothetical protein